MLISFSLKNWMSFRDETSFSMVASRERQHGERLPRLGKYQLRLLPIAALYGGNASGKSNFCKALAFAQRLIVRGTQPDSLIPVEPFRLDRTVVEEPSTFRFEILVDEIIYELFFSVTKKSVLEEKLTQLLTSSEKIIYHRKNDEITFDRSLSNDDFLKFVFKGTRSNQLFLTNSINQNVALFQPIFNWFKSSLEVVMPNSRFNPFEYYFYEDHPLIETINTLLQQLDTGICRLGSEPISFDNIGLTDTQQLDIQENLKDGMTGKIISKNPNNRVVLVRNGDDVVARKLYTYHTREDGTETKFEIDQESDGSRRLIDIAPLFLDLTVKTSKKVFIIDEIDRSLHTLLTRKLIEEYLSNCSVKSRTQLLFTTHDVLLMDQRLLRRDEMWVTERTDYGASDLFSFNDFKDIRYDKDIRKTYLQGRLGGVPRILMGTALAGNPSPSSCELDE